LDEHVIIDGPGPSSVEANTLNAPFPATRTGFLKLSFLVAAKPGVDIARFFEHWLNAHAGNVADVMRRVGGLRYILNPSAEPDVEQYAGLAELWFPDRDSVNGFFGTLRSDGMEEWADVERTVLYEAVTEMVGIP
jgi:hypothetical protein